MEIDFYRIVGTNNDIVLGLRIYSNNNDNDDNNTIRLTWLTTKTKYRHEIRSRWHARWIKLYANKYKSLTFSVRHLNAIKSTAGRSFLGIKRLPALQQT
jgi:hypothetical protein